MRKSKSRKLSPKKRSQTRTLPKKGPQKGPSKSVESVVVGIGASSGGMEAVQEFLKELPVNSGMAYVVIQHLDPSRASELVHILSRSTGMPVTEIAHGMKVQPNCIYIIPPNSTVHFSKNELLLTKRTLKRPSVAAIDLFLESLASGIKDKANGIIF
jgi:two-component system CheB/CheR fusion protein